jgi:23S rRNA pseudouridine2605 synthase
LEAGVFQTPVLQQEIGSNKRSAVAYHWDMPRAMVRLDRALSKLGIASRTEAKRLIADGRVRVSGRTVLDPARLVLPGTAAIAVDGQRTTPVAWRAIALHKPRGVVTTRRDPDGRPTVFDILGADAGSLVAVGRLDLASTGLLLLTTDTGLAHDLTDPARGVVRRYIVTVRGKVSDESTQRMRDGIDGLHAHTVVVRKRSNRESHLIIELVEGRNREIRRMVTTLGHEVTKLMRVAFGAVALGTLQPGEWRDVDRRELDLTLDPSS